MMRKAIVGFLLAVGPSVLGAEIFDDWESDLIETPTTRSCTTGNYKIINDNADWGDINEDFDTFCVAPGDYSGRADVKITADGTAGTPKVIQYYDPADPTDVQHAVDHTEAERAWIPKLEFSGANWWEVARLYGSDRTGDTASLIKIKNESNHILLDQLFLDYDTANLVSIADGSDNVTLQYSVLRNARSPNPDIKSVNCMNIITSNAGGDVSNIHVLHNEIYDCFADGVQIANSDKDGNPIAGIQFIYEGNHMFRTPYMYHDDAGRWSTDPDANCVLDECVYACGENAIDVKTTGTTAQGLSRIHHNVFWGARWGGLNVGLCDDNGGPSPEIILHQIAGRYGQNGGVQISDNVFMDSRIGIRMGDNEPKWTSIWRNLFYDIGNLRVSHEKQAHIIYEGNGTTEMYGNIFRGSTTDAPGAWIDFLSPDIDVRSNVIVDTDEATGNAGANSFVGWNAYYGGTGAYGGTNDIGNDLEYGTIAAGNLDDFCFTRRPLELPTPTCIPDVVTTGSSPHYQALYSNPGDVNNQGVNNVSPISVVTPFESAVVDETLGVQYLITLAGLQFAEGTSVDYWVLDVGSPETEPTNTVNGTTTVARDSQLSSIAVTSLGLDATDTVLQVLEEDVNGYLGAYNAEVQ